jgi:hypothetical protein
MKTTAFLSLAVSASVLLATVGTSEAVTYDLQTDWSDAANANGVWSYREGNNLLPQVTSWQSSLGGWTTAQPGWADSENGSDRIPFWFKSNGSENFARDYLAGDIVIHTTDGASGAGNGFGNVAWTSPLNGFADISGAVWMGRDIGRSNHWRLMINGVTVTEGDISSGDIYDRASPFNLATGTGGSGAVTNVPVSIGTIIALEFERTSVAGDFVGTKLTIDAVPEPSSVLLCALGLLGALARRRRSARS